MHDLNCEWLILYLGCILNCDSPILEALYLHFPCEPGYRVWSLVSAQNQNKEDLFDILEKALIKKRWKIRRVNRSENCIFAENNRERQCGSIKISTANANNRFYNLAISEGFGIKSWTIIFGQAPNILVYWNNHNYSLGRDIGDFCWSATKNDFMDNSRIEQSPKWINNSLFKPLWKSFFGKRLRRFTSPKNLIIKNYKSMLD